jgi:hypothetical protein
VISTFPVWRMEGFVLSYLGHRTIIADSSLLEQRNLNQNCWTNYDGKPVTNEACPAGASDGI